MRITIDDVRAIHCTFGARRWFTRHGLDFRAFLREGIDAETFLARGDHLSREVVRHKLAREADLAGVVIRARDVRRFCPDGLRERCRQLGVDERRFFLAGVPATELLALNDPRIDQVVLAKLKEELRDV